MVGDTWDWCYVHEVMGPASVEDVIIYLLLCSLPCYRVEAADHHKQLSILEPVFSSGGDVMESNRGVVCLEPRTVEHGVVLKLVSTNSAAAINIWCRRRWSPSSWV